MKNMFQSKKASLWKTKLTLFLNDILKAAEDKNSSEWLKKNYFLSAAFQANPTDISWQKVVFLVIQNYALLQHNCSYLG